MTDDTRARMAGFLGFSLGFYGTAAAFLLYMWITGRLS